MVFLTYVWIRGRYNSFRQRTGGPGFDSQTLCLVTGFRAALGQIGASRWCKGSDPEAEYWPISSPRLRAPQPAYFCMAWYLNQEGIAFVCVNIVMHIHATLRLVGATVPWLWSRGAWTGRMSGWQPCALYPAKGIVNMTTNAFFPVPAAQSSL
jgi:hypothetical protein